jgi:hypothetical protein
MPRTSWTTAGRSTVRRPDGRQPPDRPLTPSAGREPIETAFDVGHRPPRPKARPQRAAGQYEPSTHTRLARGGSGGLVVVSTVRLVISRLVCTQRRKGCLGGTRTRTKPGHLRQMRASLPGRFSVGCFNFNSLLHLRQAPNQLLEKAIGYDEFARWTFAGGRRWASVSSGYWVCR